MIEFRLAQIHDVEQIARIEASAFPVDLTSIRQEMLDHLAAYPETFLVAAAGSSVLGYILGPSGPQRYLDERVLENYPNNPADSYQWVLSLVVAPAYRRQGIASKLLTLFADTAKHLGRKGVSLTCVRELVPFYEQNDYINEGKSVLAQGSDVLYNLVKII